MVNKDFRASLIKPTAALLTILIVSIVVDDLGRDLGTAVAILGMVSIVLFYKWSGDAAEVLSRSKGFYHPQYFVLGPIGLIMAILRRRRN